MKAVAFHRYGGPEQLTLCDCSVPEPKEGEVRVRVHAVSVNDWDYAALRGTPWINRLFFGLLEPWRRILGSDVSGTIESVGAGVHRLKPGDEVFGDLSGRWGGLAEFVCAPETAVMLKPRAMSHVQAAALPQAGLLALQGLELGGELHAGQHILINGAGGGVGTIAVQLARHRGLRITAVDSASKARLLLSLGASECVDYAREDFTRRPDKYDYILDVRSTRSPFDYARALVRGGRYVTVGGDTTRLLGILAMGGPIRWVHQRHLRILGLRANLGLERLSGMFEEGRLAPVIDGCYRLQDSAEAFRRFGSGNHQGKVVIQLH